MKKWFVVLLHIGYWLLYLLLLLAVLQLAGRTGGSNRRITTVLYWLFRPPLLWVAILPAMLSFYVFYFVVFSRFLQRKKMAALLWSGPVAALSVTLLSLILIYADPPKKGLSAGEFLAMYVSMSLLALVHGVIALIIKGFVSWYGDIRLKERLMQRNDEMELALVKSQLNPHFLFNTLNNIDVLIGKDPQLASAYLNKLSDILRFMLYETKTEKIPLEKEMLYIGRYIDLQKIRTANPDYIHYTVEGEPGGWVIAPMIFIPFIENAFKHADNKKTSRIRVSLHIGKGTLIFCCENSHAQQRDSPPDHSGLGNGLIQKRLNLLYPDSHVLEISDADGIYKAKLSLNGNTP
ncbi:MAG: sensor histidine kinase [Chitinophagaceae bacterium]|nr:sensor histidine kinase [Chitinophagaceae bacterium]